MAISIIFICVLAYLLGTWNCTNLVCRLTLEDKGDCSSYRQVLKKHSWKGFGYVLLADFIKAMVVVLIGGLLLKGKGFPSVGKLLAVLFGILGQALPVTGDLKPREELIWPGLLLLWLDWRIFLICTVAALVLYVLTQNRGLCALVCAVVFPVFMGIFGGWWLKVLMAVFCSLALLYCHKGAFEKVLGAFGRPHSTDSGSGSDSQPPEA